MAIALGLAGHAAPARADGDPASDVLATQTLFLPQDGGIPVARQEQLAALLKSAQRAGLTVRVALIATPSDLGSVIALWRRPADYARFLGQELSLVYRGTLLVAMPNGFGVFRAGDSAAAERAAVAAVARAAATGARGAGASAARSSAVAPGAGSSLAVAALAAVQGLAAQAGHPLTVPSVSAPAAAAASVDAAAWAAFAAGVAVIGLAWGASLRARPLRVRGHDRIRGWI